VSFSELTSYSKCVEAACVCRAELTFFKKCIDVDGHVVLS